MTEVVRRSSRHLTRAPEVLPLQRSSGPRALTKRARSLSPPPQPTLGAPELTALDPKRARTSDRSAHETRPLSRAVLGRGRPFAADLVALGIVPFPLNRAGLAEVYSSALANTRAVVIRPRVEGTPLAFTYMVTWLDAGSGEVVAQVGRALRRSPDGSLELHSNNVWAHPKRRGSGFSEKVLAREVELLRCLSEHPNTRLSLRAGSMIDPTQAPEAAHEERLGLYVWANFGFEFADAYGLRSDDLASLFGYPPRTAELVGAQGQRESSDKGGRSDLELLRAHFHAWLDEAIARGQVSAGDRVRRDIRAASRAWRQPWDIAQLTIPGVDAEITLDGRPTRVALGKAFFLGGSAPGWDGALFVNRRDAEGLARLEARVAARRARDARDAAETAPPALKVLDLHLGKQDAPMKTQAQIALDPTRSASDRVDALERVFALSGRIDLELFRALTSRDADPATAHLALLLLEEHGPTSKPTHPPAEAARVLGAFAHRSGASEVDALLLEAIDMLTIAPRPLALPALERARAQVESEPVRSRLAAALGA